MYYENSKSLVFSTYRSRALKISFLKSSNNVLAQYSNLDKIKRIYIEATGDEAAFSGTKRNKLGSLLEMINVLSHKPVKSSEIPENARFLLSFMEDMDKVHLNALKNDIEKY